MKLCYRLLAFFLQISTTSILASTIANNSLGSVPLGVLLASAALCAPFVPTWVQTYGAARAFMASAVCGVVGALISLTALMQSQAQFGLLILGTIPQGFAFACANNFRFAVIRFATPETAPRAIALVMAGGIFSAGIGPEASKRTRLSMTPAFAGTYVLLTGIYVLFFFVLWMIEFDKYPAATDGTSFSKTKNLSESNVHLVETQDLTPSSASANTITSLPQPSAPPRPLSVIIRDSRVLWIVFLQSIGFASMAAIMTATPPLMRSYGFGYNDSTSVVELHQIGMFLPALLTGDLVRIFGPSIMMIAGFLLSAGGLFITLPFVPPS